jgi:hypothetical protein
VYDVNLKVSLPTTANSFHLVYGLQVHKHFHLAFVGGEWQDWEIMLIFVSIQSFLLIRSWSVHSHMLQ